MYSREPVFPALSVSSPVNLNVCMHSSEYSKRLPTWFKIRLSATKKSSRVRNIIDSKQLNTVCASAACPNRCECWSAGTATFMILGALCSRRCGFCAVPKGDPKGVDLDEPSRIADAVVDLGLRYAVITSVTRDDLPDGGAALFVETIRSIRSRQPGCRIEVLIPDFAGSTRSLDMVLDAAPDILNHNIETVPSLYPRVRPKADYNRSLEILGRASRAGTVTKSGLMLGLGEGRGEFDAVLEDLRKRGCSMLTVGQYLRPGRINLPVERYYHPDEFNEIREYALALGFDSVQSGPLVRSSYHAETSSTAHTINTCISPREKTEYPI